MAEKQDSETEKSETESLEFTEDEQRLSELILHYAYRSDGPTFMKMCLESFPEKTEQDLHTMVDSMNDKRDKKIESQRHKHIKERKANEEKAAEEERVAKKYQMRESLRKSSWKTRIC